MRAGAKSRATGEGAMRHVVIGIVLRGMGSFHVGGRIAEVSGKPVRMIQRQPGGPLTKLDPNGQYMVEQMYVQYFLPKKRKGKLPLLMWHGRARPRRRRRCPSPCGRTD